MELPCLFLQIRKADRQLNQLYGKYLAQNGMRITQYGLLRAVDGLREPSITEIGQVLGLDQTTATRNLEKLEQLGFVYSEPSPTDSRKKIVRLTPLGASRLEEAQPNWEQAQQVMVSGLEAAEVQELLRLLAKVCHIAEADGK